MQGLEGICTIDFSKNMGSYQHSHSVIDSLDFVGYVPVDLESARIPETSNTIPDTRM